MILTKFNVRLYFGGIISVSISSLAESSSDICSDAVSVPVLTPSNSSVSCTSSLVMLRGVGSESSKTAKVCNYQFDNEVSNLSTRYYRVDYFSRAQDIRQSPLLLPL